MLNQKKIAIVDDDKNIANLINIYLKKSGYETHVYHSAKDFIETLEDEKFDMVLLDVMLPEIDGFTALCKIREEMKTPVILITAKNSTFDKVKGLELGADDYIVKPFDSMELLARVKAVLRRYEEADSSVLTMLDLTFDQKSYTILYNGEEMTLPPKEMALLSHFMSYPNRVFTREQLIDAIWGVDSSCDFRTVDVHVKRLRSRFAEEKKWFIKTVWGVGYKLMIRRCVDEKFV